MRRWKKSEPCGAEEGAGRVEAARGGAQPARERERGGRLLVAASTETGEMVDRIAGLEESCAARRQAAALTPRIADWELAVGARRGEFLAKRIERGQVETLIRKAEANEASEPADASSGRPTTGS